MSIQIACEKCSTVLKVADEALGKSVRCPKCKEVFTANAPPPKAEPADSFGAREDVIPSPRADAQPQRTRRSEWDDDRESEARLPRGRDREPRLRRPQRAKSAAPLVIGLVIGLALMAGVVVAAVMLLPKLTEREWVTFVSPDGTFSVDMPGVPQTQVQPIPGTNTHMKLHVLDLKRRAFFATFVEVPPHEMRLMPIDQRFSAARDGMISKTPGSVVESEKPITFEKHPGRDVVLKIPQGRLITRMIAVDNRMYMIMVAGDSITPDHAEVVKFFASFKVLPKNVPPPEAKKDIQPVPEKPMKENPFKDGPPPEIKGPPGTEKKVPAANSFEGLIGYWSFDEPDGSPSAFDGSGAANNGKIHGAAQRVTGIRVSGLKFDGKSFVDLGNAKRFNFARQQPFTIAGWFKLDGPLSGSLLRLGAADGTDTLDLRFANGQLQVVRGSDSATIFNQWNTERWRHFALVRTKDAQVMFYLDTIPLPVAHRWCGPVVSEQRKLGEGFQGTLDEVCIFNRELNLQAIRQLAGHIRGFVERPLPPVKLESEELPPDPVTMTIPLPQRGLSSLAFDASGKLLVGAFNENVPMADGPGHGIVFWDAQSGKRLKTHRGRGPMQLAKNAERLLCSSNPTAVEALSLQNDEIKTIAAGVHNAWRWTSDEKYLMVLSDKVVRRIEVDQPNMATSCTLPSSIDIVKFTPGGEFKTPGRAEFSPNGAFLAATLGAKKAVLYSTADAKILWEFPCAQAAFRFSADGQYVAVCSRAFPAKGAVLHVVTGKSIHTLANMFRDADPLAFSPDNKLLACADNGGSVGIWSLDDGQRKCLIVVGDRLGPSAAFSPDGSKLAVAAYAHLNSIQLIDLGIALKQRP